MDAIGAQEILCPVLTPVELWEATGRDRHPRDLPRARTGPAAEYILPITHEETFTFHAREIQSYKSCRSSGTTSRRRTGTSRARAAACSACASSS